MVIHSLSLYRQAADGTSSRPARNRSPDVGDLMAVWGGDKQPDEFSICSFLGQTFTEQLLEASSCPGYWGYSSEHPPHTHTHLWTLNPYEGQDRSTTGIHFNREELLYPYSGWPSQDSGFYIITSSTFQVSKMGTIIQTYFL